MKLVIAEKPSLAKAIREAVGKDYTMTNAFGHIYEQAEPDDYLPDDLPRSQKTGKKIWRFEDLPIIPSTWKKHPKADAKEQIGKIKETSGIGTEATRANVIETLFKRTWIEKKGKQIISTQTGRAVILALPSELTDPVTTARWEDHLSSIAAGRLTADRFESAIADFVKVQIALAKPAAGAADIQKTAGKAIAAGKTAPCPVCGKTARRMESKKKAGSFYWACENRGHGLLSDDKGKPGKEFGGK